MKKISFPLMYSSSRQTAGRGYSSSRHSSQRKRPLLRLKSTRSACRPTCGSRCATGSRSPPTSTARRPRGSSRSCSSARLTTAATPRPGRRWPRAATSSSSRTRADGSTQKGEFYPFRHEAEDGYDTVEWAAALDALGRAGRDVRRLLRRRDADARGDGQAAAPRGDLPLHHGLGVLRGVDLPERRAHAVVRQFLDLVVGRRHAAPPDRGRSRPREWVAALPVEGYRLLDPPPAAEAAPYYRDWVEHERDDDYWRRWRISDHYGALTVKGLHAGGWHDLFLKGSIQNYVGYRGAASPGGARRAAAARRPVGARRDFGRGPDRRRRLRPRRGARHERDDH